MQANINTDKIYELITELNSIIHLLQMPRKPRQEAIARLESVKTELYQAMVIPKE